MSELTDRWAAPQAWDGPLRPRWLLATAVAFWVLMAIVSVLIFRDAWRGGMIGSRWLWLAVSIFLAARSVYRASKLVRALRIGAYRGGAFDR